MATKNWADDSSTSSHPDLQPPQITYKELNKNTKIKTEIVTLETQQITRVYKVTKTSKAVKERRKWKKFGAEAAKQEKKTWNDEEEESRNGTFSGPSLGEEVKLKCVLGKNWDLEPEVDENAKGLKTSGGRQDVKCRLCSQAHWTAHCPYKATLGNPDEGSGIDFDAGQGDGTAGQPTSKPGRYIPPGMRGAGGGRQTAEEAQKAKEDSCTIRITNLSEEISDQDLRDLTSKFGSTGRTFLSKDRDTGRCKGYAFVTYNMREDAEKAMARLHGFGYDNLILHVEWARTRDS